jgi:hypothetical protein
MHGGRFLYWVSNSGASTPVLSCRIHTRIFMHECAIDSRISVGAMPDSIVPIHALQTFEIIHVIYAGRFRQLNLTKMDRRMMMQGR